MKSKKFKILVEKLKKNLKDKDNIGNKYPCISAIGDFKEKDYSKYKKLLDESARLWKELEHLKNFDLIKEELVKTKDKRLWDIFFQLYENLLFDYEEKYGHMDINFLLPIVIKRIKDYDFTHVFLQYLRNFGKYYPNYKTYIEKVKKEYTKDASLYLILKQIDLARQNKKFDNEYNFFIEYDDILTSISDKEYVNIRVKKIAKKKYLKLIQESAKLETNKQMKSLLNRIEKKLKTKGK